MPVLIIQTGGLPRGASLEVELVALSTHFADSFDVDMHFGDFKSGGVSQNVLPGNGKDSVWGLGLWPAGLPSAYKLSPQLSIEESGGVVADISMTLSDKVECAMEGCWMDHVCGMGNVVVYSTPGSVTSLGSEVQHACNLVVSKLLMQSNAHFVNSQSLKWLKVYYSPQSISRNALVNALEASLKLYLQLFAYPLVVVTDWSRAWEIGSALNFDRVLISCQFCFLDLHTLNTELWFQDMA